MDQQAKEKKTDYKVCAIKIGGGVVMGYVPDRDNYPHVGDEVRLEGSSAWGTILLVDDYVPYEKMVQWEQLTGVEYQKIIAIYSREEVNWDV